MRKFLTKAKTQLLILGLVFIGLLTVAGNISLAVNRETIDKEFEGFFIHDITVGPIFYVFPNFIVLKDIVVKKAASSIGHGSFVLPKVMVRFSIRELFFRGLMSLSDVTLYPSEVSYYSVSQFLEDNFQKILEVIRNSPDSDITIRVKEILLDFDRKGKPDYVAMELLLTVHGGSLEGAGLFRTDQYRFPARAGGEVRRLAKGWPLWYKFKGQLKQDGLAIEHLTFKSGNLYSKLWGSIHSGALRINGFMFMDTTKQDPDETEYSSLRNFKKFPVDDEISNVDVYVLDIDGMVRLAFPEIKVEQFNFTANNIPVTLKGNISLLDPLTLDADLSFHHAHPPGRKDVFFGKGDVHLTGLWKDNVLHTNGRMDIDFIEPTGLSFSPETAQITFTDLAFRLDRHKRTVINLAHGDIAYWTNTNEHKVSIEDFKAVANAVREGLKNVEIDAPFYDGSLNGRMWIDSTRTPSKVTSQFVLTDVDTDALEELLVHFAKFNGRMSGKVNFTNIPQLDLSGDITIYDGRLTDFNFFNWVSDSFRLPALKSIEFGRASAQFSLNKEYIQLRDIHLKTEDVHIGGYFDVNNENLVSSKLTIALSQGFLSESPKFRPILKIFDDDHSHLDFEFQLSGNMEAMNFQWLPSEVKRKIQKRIPDFVERLIEKNIDEMMEAD